MLVSLAVVGNVRMLAGTRQVPQTGAAAVSLPSAPPQLDPCPAVHP